MSNQLNKNNNNIQNSHKFNEEEFFFIDIILFLASYLKILIIVPIILCIFTFIYTLFFVKPIYTSTAKIMSTSGGRNNSQALGIAAQFGINIPKNQSEQKWVYAEIVKSRTLAKVVLERKFDKKQYGKQKSLFQILKNINNLNNLDLESLKSLTVKNLLSMINISEDKKTSILTLSVNASEARFAAEINQALIEELDAHQRRYNKDKTSETKNFIEDRIKSIEKELVASEESLRVFRDRNRRIENSPALQLEEQRLRREVTVMIGVFTTLKQQLETTKIEEFKESDYVLIVDAPEVPLQKSNPSKRQSIILAGIFGIGFGILIAIIIDFVTKSKDREKILKARDLVLKNLTELIPQKNK